MSSKGSWVIAGLLGLWASTGGAAQSVGRGTIAFSGSIVEPGCATNAHSGQVTQGKGCAAPGRANRFDVRSLMPVAGAPVPRLSPVADSGGGRHHDQRYVLVDGAGQPIMSGNYVVTVTTP
jgi:hypothetical protein